MALRACIVRLLLPVSLSLMGCTAEPLIHGLDEPQANEILVALDEASIPGEKRREDGNGRGWIVTVSARDVAGARRILAERELPRPRAPGLGDVFGEAGMVPTPIEEHARYLHALSGELSRSLESLDGVVGARVHLGLPQEDPLRPGDRRPARAAVLLRCRPDACDPVRAMEPGIRSLVAGAAEGLSPDAVAFLVAEATPAPRPSARETGATPWRFATAAFLALAAVGTGVLAAGRRLSWRLRRPT